MIPQSGLNSTIRYISKFIKKENIENAPKKLSSIQCYEKRIKKLIKNKNLTKENIWDYVDQPYKNLSTNKKLECILTTLKTIKNN